jgi:hypothetical protein
MTEGEILAKLEKLPVDININSDGDIVASIRWHAGWLKPERVIQFVGSENSDFRCIRHRSGRSVTFHAIGA